MGRGCTVCQHEQREAIDQGLAQGEPLREIARRFEGISKTSLIRHKAGHLAVVDTEASDEGSGPEVDQGTEAADDDPFEAELATTEDHYQALKEQCFEQLPDLQGSLDRLRDEEQMTVATIQRLDKEVVRIEEEISKWIEEEVGLVAEGGDAGTARAEVSRLRGELILNKVEAETLRTDGKLSKVRSRRDQLIGDKETLEKTAGEYLNLQAEGVVQRIARLSGKLKDLKASIAFYLSCDEAAHSSFRSEGIEAVGRLYQNLQAWDDEQRETQGKIEGLGWLQNEIEKLEGVGSGNRDQETLAVA